MMIFEFLERKGQKLPCKVCFLSFIKLIITYKFQRIVMITIFVKKIKSFSQKDYNKFINTLPFHKLSCTCEQKGSLIKHGYYLRSIKTREGLIPLYILRVKCKSCNKTHAILPSLIVPYSRILYDDQVSIIHAYLSQLSFEPIMLSNLLIDESNIRYIIHQYLTHWKERIASFSGSLQTSLIGSCFEHFARQFMQIKSTPNILFLETT